MSDLVPYKVEVRKATKRPESVDWRALVERLNAWPDASLSDDEKDKRWFLRQLAGAMAGYVSAFCAMKERRFYPAWCTLEEAEIAFKTLLQNPFFEPERYRVPEWISLVEAWQELFPYAVFLSPGMKVLRAECSICGEPQHIDSFCGHVAGKVYAGKFCSRVITKAEMREVSMVLKPVQKYSVAFADLDDPTRYSLVAGVVEMLSGPFDGWRVKWTKRLHPHELFAHVQPSEPCPCGGSASYEVCCGTRLGVERPHANVLLDKTPIDGIPASRLLGYRRDQLERLR